MKYLKKLKQELAGLRSSFPLRQEYGYPPSIVGVRAQALESLVTLLEGILAIDHATGSWKVENAGEWDDYLRGLNSWVEAMPLAIPKPKEVPPAKPSTIIVSFDLVGSQRAEVRYTSSSDPDTTYLTSIEVVVVIDKVKVERCLASPELSLLEIQSIVQVILGREVKLDASTRNDSSDPRASKSWTTFKLIG